MKGIAVLLVAFGLVPIAASPAVAAPGDGRQFRQGYDNGFTRGFEAARTDCVKPARAETFEITDYTRGYAVGFSRGFNAGMIEFCTVG